MAKTRSKPLTQTTSHRGLSPPPFTSKLASQHHQHPCANRRYHGCATQPRRTKVHDLQVRYCIQVSLPPFTSACRTHSLMFGGTEGNTGEPRTTPTYGINTKNYGLSSSPPHLSQHASLTVHSAIGITDKKSNTHTFAPRNRILIYRFSYVYM